MFVLGVIPARGGSKGLSRKNLRMLGGQPLISYSIQRAKGSELIDRTIISTDDREIAQVALDWGGDVPFFRPPPLATDSASMIQVLQHAVRWMESEGGVPRVDLITCMQPTSPLGTTSDLDKAVGLALDHDDCDAIMSVCEVEHTPYYMKRIVEGRLLPLMPDDDPRQPLQNRQAAPFKVYRPAGVVSVTKRRVLMEDNLRYGLHTIPLILEQRSSVNIDHEVDLLLAERVLQEQQGQSDR